VLCKHEVVGSIPSGSTSLLGAAVRAFRRKVLILPMRFIGFVPIERSARGDEPRRCRPRERGWKAWPLRGPGVSISDIVKRKRIRLSDDG
jgi:hypothetical protein